MISPGQRTGSGVVLHPVNVVRAHLEDLPAVNRVVESAVRSWPISPRVARQVVPILCYDAVDLRCMEGFVAYLEGRPLGVAFWESFVSEPETGEFHGLYVASEAQKLGLGRRLQVAVLDSMLAAGVRRVHLRAERFAVDYFCKYGYQQRTVAENQYPWQFSMDLREGPPWPMDPGSAKAGDQSYAMSL